LFIQPRIVLKVAVALLLPVIQLGVPWARYQRAVDRYFGKGTALLLIAVAIVAYLIQAQWRLP
jgi:hypothetical protein